MFSFSVLSILLLFFLSEPSYQDQKDPLKDFCRRFGHATAVIDERLFIDGGLLNWNPISQNPNNFTNPYLLYSSLTALQDGMPQQCANLTNPSTVPDVSGGILWADDVNKFFYQFGGEFQGSPQPFDALPFYDALQETWNSTNIPDDLNRVSFGAGVAVNDRAEGYYLGGWMGSQTTPSLTGNAIATGNLIRYDMIKNTFTNNTGPDTQGRAEGTMVYLPAGDSGLLVYFGGIIDPSRNGTMVASPMSTIYIFDILSGKWYTQTASGDVPASRRRFCAGATWADDHSSYNIYLYGGISIPNNNTVFDDVYILTLPSFKWIKWWPTQGPFSSEHGHHSLTCNVINRSQMLIIGGTFPNTLDCDAPNQLGTHNLNLGANGPSKSLWDLYYPNITQYTVPTEIVKEIGGGGSGGASVLSPQKWDSPDLQVYFTRVASMTARTPTRAIPTATSPSKPAGLTGSRGVGLVIGAVLGGLLFLAAILISCLFLFRRIKKQRQERGRERTPAELEVTSQPSELYTSHPSEEEAKYFGTGYSPHSPPPAMQAFSHEAQSIPTGQGAQIFEMGGGASRSESYAEMGGGGSPLAAGMRTMRSGSASKSSYTSPISPPAGVFPMGPYYAAQESAESPSPRSLRGGSGRRERRMGSN